MKKCEKTVFNLVLAIVLLFVSCENSNNLNEQDVAQQLFEENPVTITWTGSNSDEINSFQTDVSVYVSNNRNNDGAVLMNQYRLAVKTIDNELVSRLDFVPEFNDDLYTSVATNNTETILFDTKTENIEMRLLNSETTNANLRIFEQQSSLSRINIDSIKKEAQRLSFDIQEDSKSLIIDIPNSYFDNQYERRISTRTSFDIQNEILLETEILSIQNDGTEVKTITYPVYEEKNGEPIKIGSVTIVESIPPYMVEGFEDIEYFNSLDEIPEITDSEYNLLMESGAVEVENFQFGDPADLSYTETIVEIYNDIEINNVSDNVFRLLMRK